MAHLPQQAVIIDWRIAPPIPDRTLAGTVTGASGQPAAGCTVRAYREAGGDLAGATKTASNGSYTMRVWGTGPYTLVFSGEPGRNALVLAGVTAV